MNDERSGFSLVEVCLALLVVAMGLLAILGLFPGGVRSSENAEADTYAALFADTVLSGIAANAATITDWNTWNNDAAFSNAVVNGLALPASPAQFPPAVAGAESGWLRYTLSFTRVSDRLRTVRLDIWPGRYGASNNPETIGTELYYWGM